MSDISSMTIAELFRAIREDQISFREIVIEIETREVMAMSFLARFFLGYPLSKLKIPEHVELAYEKRQAGRSGMTLDEWRATQTSAGALSLAAY